MTIHFEDHPEFKPNLTPEDIFLAGAFSGTYFRDIHSKVLSRKLNGKQYARKYKCLSKVPLALICRNDGGDIQINKYKCKVGMSLEYWEDHKWIHPSRPFGWVEWYCGFYDGNRGPDDARQIKRWQGVAGAKGRFRTRFINEIKKQKAQWNNKLILPKIRQILLTWGYQLSKQDMKPKK